MKIAPDTVSNKKNQSIDRFANWELDAAEPVAGLNKKCPMRRLEYNCQYLYFFKSLQTGIKHPNNILPECGGRQWIGNVVNSYSITQQRTGDQAAVAAPTAGNHDRTGAEIGSGHPVHFRSSRGGVTLPGTSHVPRRTHLDVPRRCEDEFCEISP